MAEGRGKMVASGYIRGGHGKMATSSDIGCFLGGKIWEVCIGVIKRRSAQSTTLLKQRRSKHIQLNADLWPISFGKKFKRSATPTEELRLLQTS